MTVFYKITLTKKFSKYCN